jgi:hypothetical protein
MAAHDHELQRMQQRLADLMPSEPVVALRRRDLDPIDVLVAAAWGACLGVLVVHACKALVVRLSRMRRRT